MRYLTGRVLTGCLVLSLGFAVGCGSSGGSNTPPAITVAIVPGASQSIDGGQSVNLTAAVANDSTNAGVTWSVSGGGTLSGTSISAATYNAPATVTAATNVTVTATSNASTGAMAAHAIVVNPPPVVTSSGALSAGTAGTVYSATLAASGGSGTLAWSLPSGSTLPAGLALSAAGAISGTPTTAGNYTFTVTVTDASAATPVAATSGSLSLTINPAPLVVTAPALANAVQGTAYTSPAFTSTGGTGAVTWSATGLPAGLSIGASSGVIGGTPTASGAIANLVVTATDSGAGAFQQTKATAALSLTVIPTLALTTTTLPAGTAGVAYSATLAASGGVTPYVWSSGTLPAGLTLNAATGAISGTPTATNTGAIAFTVSDAGTPKQTQQASLTLTLGAGAPDVTTTSIPTASVGVLYTTTLTANADGQTGAATWAVSSGTLPAPFTLAPATGIISGTPTATGGPFNFSVTVTIGGVTSAAQALSLTVSNAPSVTTATLPPAYVGTAYTTTLAASGGSGAPYAWSVTAGQSTLTTIGLTLSSAGVLSGTPTATGSGSVTFQVKDSSGAAGTASLNLAAYAALALPAPNPASLPAASTSGAYTGAINAAGGVPGYTWTVNGAALATTGAAVALTNGLGLSVSNTGTSTLNVTGTPTATGTVTFTASVTDSNGATVGPKTYTIAVTTSYSASGSVQTFASCTGSNSVSGVTITATDSNNKTVGTATTDGSGNFTITGLATGAYTLTPTYSAPGSATTTFSPATQAVTIATANLTSENFSVGLGYTVSGTVSYSGSDTGRIYLTLSNNSCPSYTVPGTSISSTGAFTIRGVAPGTYTLQARMDNLGYGAPNASNPSGSTTGITVSNADVTGASVTMTPAAAVTLTLGPELATLAGVNTGALVIYNPQVDNNGLELATSYTLQWSTDSSFGTVTGSKTFPATGPDSSTVWLVNGLANGTYYFRASGTAGSSTSSYSAVSSAVTVGAPTGADTVSGAVTFTGTATGPLYAGCYDQKAGQFYGDYIASPVSPQAYTVQVPSGSNCSAVGILDNNKDGVVDAGDITNVGGSGVKASQTITGATTLNLTLASANATAAVATQNYQSENQSGSQIGQNYSLQFTVTGNIKLPVSVYLESGPNVVPVDVSVCGNYCGGGFEYNLNIPIAPVVGDTYSFQINYSDGTSDTLTTKVTALITEFPTNLSATGGTTPTFTWTDPTDASNYTYSFQIVDSNNNTIWQIPSQNSNSSYFSSSITQIVWGTDPTGDSSNTPSVASLTSGGTYIWQISIEDSNGNYAVQSIIYMP
ncbi:MAG: beta strand repeat-containing protein [Terriglobales bacterium]